MQVRVRHVALELLVGADGVHLLHAAAQQHEAGEVAAVGVEEADLEVLDPPVALQLAEELDGLVEPVDRRALATTHYLAPSDEQAGIRHGVLLRRGLQVHGRRYAYRRGRIKCADSAPMLDERLIANLHVHELRRSEAHADRAPHVLFQASTIAALLDGAYEGDLTFAELAEHGDLGLGTLNGLDGEMIALDGRFYRADVDGVVDAGRGHGAHAVRGGGARSRRRVDVAFHGRDLRGRSSTRGGRPRRARCASTASSSWCAPARCRASSRPTGRWPRWPPSSTSSSSGT